jgi:carboxymethylenebutenolidase
VFPISGGLPLGQRAPQRQAYRLMELQRFSEHLNAPLNIKPRYFPVGGDDAARVIIAADLAQGAAAAMKVAGAVLSACWVQERYESYTQAAIDAGVFGAPSYVIGGEIFWGQDRLDFVERALAS